MRSMRLLILNLLCLVGSAVAEPQQATTVEIEFDVALVIPYGDGPSELPSPSVEPGTRGGPGQVAVVSGDIVMLGWQTRSFYLWQREGDLLELDTGLDWIPAADLSSNGVDMIAAWTGGQHRWPMVFVVTDRQASLVFDFASTGISNSMAEYGGVRVLGEPAILVVGVRGQRGATVLYTVEFEQTGDEWTHTLRNQEETYEWVRQTYTGTEEFWIDEKSGVLMYGAAAASGYFADQARYYEQFSSRPGVDVSRMAQYSSFQLIGVDPSGNSYWYTGSVVAVFTRYGENPMYYQSPAIASRQSIGTIDDEGYLWWLVHGEDAYELMRSTEPLFDPSSSAADATRTEPAFDPDATITPSYRVQTEDGTERWVYGAFLRAEE